MPARRLIEIARRPFERFVEIEASSGIALFAAALIGLVLANSPWRAQVASFWSATHALRLGPWTVAPNAAWFVNDVLMSLFFFVVGIELRREQQQGALSSLRRAALPGVAALGGMVVPGVLFLAVAPTSDLVRGAGIPVATDIAFAVGALSLLGKRVPATLRALLLALAVMDDLGAIVVIALVYSGGVSPLWLLLAACGLGVFVALHRFRIRGVLAYAVAMVMVWVGVHHANVHPTIAGVACGLAMPVGSRGDDQISAGDRTIDVLHPWVAYAVMPLFALANAGVPLTGIGAERGELLVLVGVILGLVVGKPLGVVLACIVALRLRVAAVPDGITARHLFVLGVVAGIGFTMSLFIAQLAFAPGPLLVAAKLGILLASAVAMGLTLAVGRMALPSPSA